MGNKINIMNVLVDVVTMDEAVSKVMDFLRQDKCSTVYTPNPEIIMAAQKDKELMNVLYNASLIVPDGIGVVLASRLLKGPSLPQRVAGYDLVQNIFKKISNTNYTVYFLGGAPTVAEEAAIAMQSKYKGLKIVGTHHGYFKQEDEQEIINRIQNVKPDILLVGLGAPKQEKWIEKYKKILPVKVCIGVGGSFDVMAGRIKRAPKGFQKLGLEWFYRLITQPKRAKRMLKLPIFAWNVLKISVKNSNK
ncbi:WecB/TagA/CpsF family glycosyltransferase [Defluviitalea phaphyphila]|uniref:WecB/TagA/CpsF family glycosyltransferase n=1 Tax=Defluviitalea phaphyphila TaxID=1473580 RepID=UPI0007308CB8|nr:WecB/TagA/CpsF family glycosyltransferase [Defluviitalea phaphyphila]